jgi:hypothetical protein
MKRRYYCEKMLHLREGAAYRRIEAARASRHHPELLEMLQDGRLSLATACLIAPKLGTDHATALLRQAAFKSKREVERLVAAVFPQPPVPSIIRKLPQPRAAETKSSSMASAASDVRPASAPAAEVQEAPCALPPTSALVPPPSRRPVVAPISEEHYKLQVTISAAARQRLQQIQDLMRHRLPNGDLAIIVERAFELLHAELLKQKAAEVASPRTGRHATAAWGRYIPAPVKRGVWRRDRGRCAFVAADGARCESTSGVEFHHVQPYAAGGPATEANIALRCRAHNGFEWGEHLDRETADLLSADK